MELLASYTDYDKTIKVARKLNGVYDESVIFHCYWNGNLNEKHLYSVLSCYHFNVLNKNHKIILWLENNAPNDINKEISKYCEIKQFSLKDQTANTFLENRQIKFDRLQANYYRLLILYNYGGCWFDLDCFFLRSFDPIFEKYPDKICVHQWEDQNYAGNGIVVSLEPKSVKLKDIMNFIINLKRGWGFQKAKLTYDLPLDFFVLPCSWVSPAWIKNPIFEHRADGSQFDRFFKNSDKEYNFDNFFNGAFCYHWHNRWNKPIEDNSVIKQLVRMIKKNPHYDNLENNPNKKIISFSLYGNKPCYQAGAIANVLEAKKIFPDWVCRFYTTDSPEICKVLTYLGAEVIRVDEEGFGPTRHALMFWRFLAVQDPEVKTVLVRDADSVVSERDKACVDKWLNSDSEWEWLIVRDHPAHKSVPIPGGMWGWTKMNKTENVFDFQKKLLTEYIHKEWGKQANRIQDDQRFLKWLYEKYVKGSSVLRFGPQGIRIPEHPPVAYSPFVGDRTFRGNKFNKSIPRFGYDKNYFQSLSWYYWKFQ